MSLIIDIEKALLEQTQARVNKRAFVDFLPGQFNEALMKRMLTKTPAVYWMLAGFSKSNNQPNVTFKWRTFLVTSHASGQRARRHGSATTIGGYELIELISGAKFSTDSGTLRLSRMDNLYSGTLHDKGRQVFLLEWHLPVIFPSMPDDFEVGQFREFHNDMDINSDKNTDARAEHYFTEDQ